MNGWLRIIQFGPLQHIKPVWERYGPEQWMQQCNSKSYFDWLFQSRWIWTWQGMGRECVCGWVGVWDQSGWNQPGESGLIRRFIWVRCHDCPPLQYPWGLGVQGPHKGTFHQFNLIFHFDPGGRRFLQTVFHFIFPPCRYIWTYVVGFWQTIASLCLSVPPTFSPVSFSSLSISLSLPPPSLSLSFYPSREFF